MQKSSHEIYFPSKSDWFLESFGFQITENPYFLRHISRKSLVKHGLRYYQALDIIRRRVFRPFPGKTYLYTYHNANFKKRGTVKIYCLFKNVICHSTVEKAKINLQLFRQSNKTKCVIPSAISSKNVALTNKKAQNYKITVLTCFS